MADGQFASVSGGNQNTASANSASVSGGLTNSASGILTSVSGGDNLNNGAFGTVLAEGTFNAAD